MFITKSKNLNSIVNDRPNAFEIENIRLSIFAHFFRLVLLIFFEKKNYFGNLIVNLNYWSVGQ